MASERIIVDITKLGRDAQQVYSLIQAMEKELKDMSSSVRQMGLMWEGESKTAFTAAFERDRRQAEDLVTELKALCGFENNAKKLYDQCERQVMDIASSIRI
ncbi:MAG TPA: hypothetical protein DF613_09740 [Lachnospiraceae bacterium]|nr:hypothetical protein [Lachnospiraceae bacterium]